MWILFILVGCVNGVILASVARRVLRERPELFPGYRPMLMFHFLWLNVPWLVMGFGCVMGRLSIFAYARPQDGNPFVAAFWASLFLLHLALGGWIFFRQGDQFVVRYRDLYGPYKSRLPQSARGVRIFWLVTMAGLAVAFVLLVTVFDAPQTAG